jgi:hypothetical protein
MSDGPHRSLPMRRAWKEVAKRADKRTYDATQVQEAVLSALAKDWKNEVSPALISALKHVFSGRDNSLGLPEIALDQLEAAKPLAAGSVFGANAVSWCILAAKEGRLDMASFHEAIGSAIRERGLATSRQVEEHYLRESNHRRADHVGARLESALAACSNAALATTVIDPQPSSRPGLRRQSGLDDGVALR